MDIVLVVGFFITLFIYEPGNKKINDYCRYAVDEEIHSSRMECWNTYNEWRDDIPEMEVDAG